LDICFGLGLVEQYQAGPLTKSFSSMMPTEHAQAASTRPRSPPHRPCHPAICRHPTMSCATLPPAHMRRPYPLLCRAVRRKIPFSISSSHTSTSAPLHQAVMPHASLSPCRAVVPSPAPSVRAYFFYASGAAFKPPSAVRESQSTDSEPPWGCLTDDHHPQTRPTPTAASSSSTSAS
jgi:hypothetical protein